jgi:hypothetical protein
MELVINIQRVTLDVRTETHVRFNVVFVIVVPFQPKSEPVNKFVVKLQIDMAKLTGAFLQLRCESV